jgi:hypothetical protein
MNHGVRRHLKAPFGARAVSPLIISRISHFKKYTAASSQQPTTMTTDLEEPIGTGSADTASSSDIDVPLVVHVLHDAQVMLNKAFALERQPEQQKSLPQPEQIHSDAVADVATSHEQGPLPPLTVTPTVLLQSEVEDWARLLIHREEQPLPTAADAATSTRNRNNKATAELLYQDFTALCNNTRL